MAAVACVWRFYITFYKNNNQSQFIKPWVERFFTRAGERLEYSKRNWKFKRSIPIGVSYFPFHVKSIIQEQLFLSRKR